MAQGRLSVARGGIVSTSLPRQGMKVASIWFVGQPYSQITKLRKSTLLGRRVLPFRQTTKLHKSPQLERAPLRFKDGKRTLLRSPRLQNQLLRSNPLQSSLVLLQLLRNRQQRFEARLFSTAPLRLPQNQRSISKSTPQRFVRASRFSRIRLRISMQRQASSQHSSLWAHPTSNLRRNGLSKRPS